MVSRGQKILQLLKNTKDKQPVLEIIGAQDFKECNDMNVKKMVVLSETTSNNNNNNSLETPNEAENVETFAILKPVSFEDTQPSTSGLNQMTNLSTDTFRESSVDNGDDEWILKCGDNEFQECMNEENSSSSTCNETDNFPQATSSTEANKKPNTRSTNTSQTPNTEHDPVHNIIEGIIQKKKKKEFSVKEKVSRKRMRNESEWKKRKQAIAREKGEAYISYKGNKMEAKNIVSTDLCSNKCRLKCNQKFNIEDRKRVLTEFYNLKDVNAKNALLFGSIRSLPVGRIRKNAKTHKSCSYKYTITLNNEEQIVCKTAFCKLHQISRGKIEVIKQKIKSGDSAPSQDMRGRHSNRPHKLGNNVEEAIIEHIKKFPSEASHYSRNSNPHKLYLSPVLNMSIMYRLYLAECKTEKRGVEFLVKKSSYATIFRTKFNLSFMQPKSDTCSTCDAGNANEEHRENASAAYEYQKQDREMARKNSKACYMTMDLQQTMPLPKLTTSKAFYLRQLWFYNFGIHLVTVDGDKSFMQTWTEDIAGRGSSEIASCLYNFVNSCQEVKDKQNLIIWSDSCAGQNKNFNIICIYQLMIQKGFFKSIDHKFPEVGHSYLDSDRDFGRIEKHLRRHERIFTPQQYRDLIKHACKKNSQVNDMHHCFRVIETLPSQLGLMHKKKNMLNETVPFRAIKWIRVEEFGSYLYKETYDVYTPFKKVCLLKNTKRQTNVNCELTRLNTETKVGNISDKKIDNLRVQLPYIDEEYRWFYEDLLARYDRIHQQPAEPKRRKTK